MSKKQKTSTFVFQFELPLSLAVLVTGSYCWTVRKQQLVTHTHIQLIMNLSSLTNSNTCQVSVTKWITLQQETAYIVVTTTSQSKNDENP